MKHRIKILLLIGMNLCLSGCMEAAMDFWNGPGRISPAKNKAYDECFEELRKSLPKPNVPLFSKEYDDWLTKVYTPASLECMKRKGF